MTSYMIPLECKTCCKTFSGPVPAQQHFTSREHIKKMENLKEERPGVPCHVCNISCDTIKMLEVHKQSPRHKANAEKQCKFNQFEKELTADSQDYAELHGNQSEAYEFSSLSNRGYCYLCRIELNSSTHAQSHLRGKAHKKKLTHFESMKISNITNEQPKTFPSVVLSSASHTGNLHSQLYSAPPGPSGDPGALMASSHSSNVLSCDVCGVSFSGPENAQQHYASEKHRKKANQGFANKPAYSCSLCNVTFTGPENEEIHKLSQKHKKNVQLMEKRARGEELPLSCNACNCTFTGQENAEDHFQSKKHRRNMENMNIRSGAMHRETETFTKGNPRYDQPGIAQKFETVANETDMPYLFKPLARRPEESPMFTSAFTQYISSGHNSSKEDENHYHSSQDIKTNNGFAEECEESFQAKPTQEEHSSLRKIPSEEDLIVKPIENTEDNLIIKPVDTHNDTRYRQHVDELLDVKSVKTDTTIFDSMRDESKIKAEIYTSLEQPLESLSLTTEDFSSRDTEPVRYVKNDLGNSLAPIGRGRGIFTMLRKHEENLPGKVLNTDKFNNVLLEDPNMRDESETWKKSVWSGTRAASKPDILLKSKNSREDGQHLCSNPSQSSEKIVNPAFSISPANAHSQRNDVIQQSSGESDYTREMEEYVFDSFTGRGKCYICDIDFTSSKHKSQHILGKNHLKAREVRKEMSSVGGLANSSLICKICSVTFSGVEAKEQHMMSEKHIRKERRHLTGEENDYFCDICKISCTGPESFTQHQMGSQHRKLAGISPTDGSGLLTPNFDRTQWYPCEICKCSMNTYEQLKMHERSPKHMKQLEKQLSGGQQSASGDRTQWFPCEICNVSMNTYEQLKNHEKSPKHLKQLEKRMTGNDTNDRTYWFPCDVCNCKLNTQEQLRMHETSPAHIAKLRKSQGVTVLSESSSSQFQTMTGPKLSPNLTTPLESFLSEELFPKEFLPHSDHEVKQNANGTSVNDFHQEQLIMTDKPFHLAPRLAQISTEVPGNDASAHAPGTGEAKRGQGSELAFATRSRGTRESSHKGTSASSPAEQAESSSASGTDISSRKEANSTTMDPTVNNPYAATHPYYCHTCKAPMNTRESYETHLKGKRHMQKVSTEPAPLRRYHMPQMLPDDYLPFTHTHPRNYQQELYKKAMEDNTLCFLPTGTGKTLVAVMTMSAMLDKCPAKNVLFLVDKVLLVLQQSKYIRAEIGDREYHRFNPDSDTCMDIQRRVPRIAAVCMGQQTTNGIPLWKHDVVVVTAAFCQNLLDKQILRWEDFSLVVIDEAHHCEKGHPFNSLLTTYHRRTPPENKPKILGLTASPAGKADVPKTLQMLQGLVSNMGDVRMTIVEEHENVDTLNEYQSNAEMILRPQLAPSDLMESSLKHELNTYTMHCVLKLCQISNIKYYVDFGRGFSIYMDGEDVRRIADDFVDKNIDMIQSSLNMIENENDNINKVQFSHFCMHVKSVCMALSCLEEGGVLIALQEMEDMESTDYNFHFAREFGLPTAHLQQIVARQGQGLEGNLGGVKNEASTDLHMKRLIDELTDGATICNFEDVRRISLVLVKQRCTAHLITKVLQKSDRMKRLGMNTACVVGHGGSGSADKGMNVNQQKRVLEEIKQYKYQVIVATSVAEEGVDWPECERVISLYPPSTVTALVQMRGRARRKNSKFIVLCASQEEEGKLYDIMQREKNMIAATRILIEQNRDFVS